LFVSFALHEACRCRLKVQAFLHTYKPASTHVGGYATAPQAVGQGSFERTKKFKLGTQKTTPNHTRTHTHTHPHSHARTPFATRRRACLVLGGFAPLGGFASPRRGRMSLTAG
jgi:hypothetical protein